MFTRSLKTFSSLPFQSRSLLKFRSPFLRSFSSLATENNENNHNNQLKAPSEDKVQEAKMVEFLTKSNTYVSDYMKKMNKYLLASSVLGISTATLMAMAVPVGFPSAFLILAGFALEHNGSEYILKTKPQVFTYKDQDGKIQYSSKNDFKRIAAFGATCVGYGCILGSMMSIIPVATSVLPLSAVGCLFSTLGHFTYARYAPKPYFNTIQLFISGLLTGIVGVNLVMSGSAIFMLESALNLQNVEFSTYIGLLLYNAFAGHDSQKALEDVQSGKGDYLKHASKFSENWLYALVPHFLFNMTS